MHVVVPVELQHAACDGHATGDLEGHSPDDVHAVARVRVEGGVVQLLGVVELLLWRSWGDGARPAGGDEQTFTFRHPTLGLCFTRNALFF